MSGPPIAEVEFGAKIVSSDGHLIGTRVFEASAEVKAATAPATVDGLDQAFAKCAIEVVQWTGGLIK